MKRLSMIILTAFLCLFMNINVFGNIIKPDSAMYIANNFLKTKMNENFSPELLKTEIGEQSDTLYYVFTLKSNGFIIIAANEISYPVIGYSLNNNYDETIDGFNKWMDYKKTELKNLTEQSFNDFPKNPEWERLKNIDEFVHIESNNRVEPLIKSIWGQDVPYSNLCPVIDGKNAYTGCVATVMAQLMHFHKYPERGTGYVEYNNEHTGNVVGDIGEHELDWNNMPSEVTVNSPKIQQDAVSRLMFNCGLAVRMMYTPWGSGAVFNKVAESLSNHFYYPKTMKYFEKDKIGESEFKDIIINELENGRAVAYSGGGNGGHTFICDGYENELFHFNWGWEGRSNGYFRIDNLTPSKYNYNAEQSVLVGIEPPDSEKSGLFVYSDYFVPETVFNSDSLSIEIDVKNLTDYDFKGELILKMYADDEFVVNYDIIENAKISKKQVNKFIFKRNNFRNISENTYHLRLYYKPHNNNEQICGNSFYSNNKSLSILRYNNFNDIVLSDSISLSETVFAGYKYNVQFELSNHSFVDYNNYVIAAIVENDKIIHICGESPVSLPANSESVAFDMTCSFSFKPGLYEFMLFNLKNNDTIQVNPKYYDNPVSLEIKEKILTYDAYEINDSYQLATKFSNNEKLKFNRIDIDDVNLHNAQDKDFYIIEANNEVFDATIKYNNENIIFKVYLDDEWNIIESDSLNIEFSDKLAFSIESKGYAAEYDIEVVIINKNPYVLEYSTPSENSKFYQNSIAMIEWQSNYEEPVKVMLYHKNDFCRTLCDSCYNNFFEWEIDESLSYSSEYQIKIQPLFSEEYTFLSEQFEITLPASVKDSHKDLCIYPNPAKDYLNIKNDEELIQSLDIYDISGRVVMGINSVIQSNAAVNISQLPAGEYLLKINYGKSTISQIFIKE